MKEITLEELERELSETYIDPEIFLEVYTPYLWADFIIRERPFRWFMGHPILYYPLIGVNKIKNTLGIEGKVIWSGCLL